ncbi:MAG: hypothetical protein K6T71_06480, partial [Candidatus Bipolaricaulota bacterium]|nr:hypothetical protein [Candidatus Bipolaricaulota bacterium]
IELDDLRRVQGDVAMVITNSYLSQFALDFAKSTGCVVVDRSKLAEWIFIVQSQKNPSTGAERAEDCS